MLSKLSAFVQRILNVFGLDYGAATSSPSAVSAAPQLTESARPVVAEMAKFRQIIRQGAKEKADSLFFLSQCDRFRDEIMPEYGIKIVDDADFSFFFVDRDELKAEIARTKADAADGARQKALKTAQNKLAALKRDQEKWDKYKATPGEAIRARFNIVITVLAFISFSL